MSTQLLTSQLVEAMHVAVDHIGDYAAAECPDQRHLVRALAALEDALAEYYAGQPETAKREQF